MPPTKKTKKPVAPNVAAKSIAKRRATKAAAKSSRKASKPKSAAPPAPKRKVAAASKGSVSRTNRASAVPPSTESYKHDDQAVQRPDVGVQHRFAARKPPRTYRYDSSLDPALSWDENASRDLGEWLIGLIDRVATEGETKVFAQPQEWQGGLYKIESLKAAAGLLKTLSKPYLDWAGKAERHQITGLPDVDVRKAKASNGDGKATALWELEVRGLDIFNPASMSTESTDGDNLPCWMLDTDYNGMSFFATQVFFRKTQAWDNFKRSLGASLDDSVWDHLAATVSEPFAGVEHKRIAVKVIDERGNELMVVKDLI